MRTGAFTYEGYSLREPIRIGGVVKHRLRQKNSECEAPCQKTPNSSFQFHEKHNTISLVQQFSAGCCPAALGLHFL